MSSTQSQIHSRLERYLLGSRPHHALVLAGPHTPAKEAVVKSLAARLMQRFSENEKAADVGQRVLREVHPDVVWVKEEGEDSIKIDRIREICHQMEIAPLEAGAKICILQECHRMNTAAANAFLKTLEEPPPNRFFWLMTSQVGSLLPTLLSRCLVFIFPPEDEPAMVMSHPRWKDFEQAWNQGSFESFAESFEAKTDALAFVRSLQLALRNTAVENIQTIAGPTMPQMSMVQALLSFEGITQLEAQLRSNANFSLLLESALVQLKSR
jgi:DNA polymerase III subunit delta'